MTLAMDELRRTYRDGLLEDTLPFWLPRSIDEEHGGFLTMRDHDGSLVDSDKGVWQQCRFTWLLATLYNTVEPRREWLEAAEHGIAFISEHCFDPADGRIWFHVTREGAPIRKRRYAFSEAFAAIAYAAAARATQRDELATRAVQCLDRFFAHQPTPKFTDTRPMRGIGQPMIGLNTAQCLRDDIGYEQANTVIDRCIDEIRTYFVKPELECVMEQVGVDGEVVDHFDGRLLNPGHAIEGAWFIMHEGKHRGDDELIRLGCQMLDWMWQRGWDAEYGGMLYFRDVYDKPVQEYWHDMKFWWPQNEAIIATLLAHTLTGEERYREWHGLAHEWAYRHFPDAAHGEWFGYLRRDGAVSNTLKGNLWKGPFHLPRMQWYCWQLLEDIQRDRSGHDGREEHEEHKEKSD